MWCTSKVVVLLIEPHISSVCCFFFCCFCCWWWCFFFLYVLVAVASLNLMLLQNKRKLLHLTLVLMLIGKAKGCSQRFFSLRSVASSLKKPLIVEKQNVSLQSTMIYIFFNLHLLTDFCVLDQVSICWKSYLVTWLAGRKQKNCITH